MAPEVSKGLLASRGLQDLRVSRDHAVWKDTRATRVLPVQLSTFWRTGTTTATPTGSRWLWGRLLTTRLMSRPTSTATELPTVYGGRPGLGVQVQLSSCRVS